MQQSAKMNIINHIFYCKLQEVKRGKIDVDCKYNEACYEYVIYKISKSIMVNNMGNFPNDFLPQM